MIPSETMDGDIKETSVLQEHIIGSFDYVLSFGSPEGELKLSYAR